MFPDFIRSLPVGIFEFQIDLCELHNCHRFSSLLFFNFCFIGVIVVRKEAFYSSEFMTLFFSFIYFSPTQPKARSIQDFISLFIGQLCF